MFVSESTHALKLLEIFREEQQSLALVVDEYGDVTGMVTLNDLMGAVLGRVQSGENADAEALVVTRDDGSLLVDGSLPIDDLRELLGGGALPGEDEHDYNTAAGMMIARFGRIPHAGEHFDWDGWRIEVVDLDGPRIDKLLVQRIDGEAARCRQRPRWRVRPAPARCSTASPSAIRTTCCCLRDLLAGLDRTRVRDAAVHRHAAGVHPDPDRRRDQRPAGGADRRAAAGRHARPWLPKFLADRGPHRHALARFDRRISPLLAWLEKLVRPRLPSMLDHRVASMFTGLLLVLLGLLLSLPIPLTNFLFGGLLLLFALALLERDGALMLVGWVAGAIAIAVFGVLSGNLATMGARWLDKVF